MSIGVPLFMSVGIKGGIITMVDREGEEQLVVLSRGGSVGKGIL